MAKTKFRRYNPENRVHKKLRDRIPEAVRNLVNQQDQDYIREDELSEQLEPICKDIQSDIEDKDYIEAGYSAGYLRTLLKDIRSILIEDEEIKVTKKVQRGSKTVVYSLA